MTGLIQPTIRFIGIAALGAMLISFSSCINEKPDKNCNVAVTFNVTTDTGWLPDYDFVYSRTDDIGADDIEMEYIFQIYNQGETSNPVKSFSMYRDDLTSGPFSVDLTLNAGNYDVYVWSDFYDASKSAPLFYNANDFGAITYLTPYKGDSNLKDAFRGATSFTVKGGVHASVDINLSRPLARYKIIATDLDDYENLSEVIDSYTVMVVYPLFMPAVFDNFIDKPIDSWTGISFPSTMEILWGDGNQTEEDPEAGYLSGGIQGVELGMDYVMMNGESSNVQVALEIYDDTGKLVGNSSTFSIPTVRNRTTLVYGDFLTTTEGGEITINPKFDGQYNIEYTYEEN